MNIENMKKITFLRNKYKINKKDKVIILVSNFEKRKNIKHY